MFSIFLEQNQKLIPAQSGNKQQVFENTLISEQLQSVRLSEWKKKFKNRQTITERRIDRFGQIKKREIHKRNWTLAGDNKIFAVLCRPVKFKGNNRTRARQYNERQ